MNNYQQTKRYEPKQGPSYLNLKKKTLIQDETMMFSICVEKRHTMFVVKHTLIIGATALPVRNETPQPI